MSKFLPPRLLAACASLLAGLSPLPAADRSAPAGHADASLRLTPDGGRLVVEAHGLPPAVPVFFTAAVEQAVRVAPEEITADLQLRLRLVQGRPEVLTLGLAGDGEIVGVSGNGLRDWAVRQGAGAAAGRRFLDLRPLVAESPAGARDARPPDLDLRILTRRRGPVVPGHVSVLLLAPGDAVGFSARIGLRLDPALEARVVAADGLVALGDDRNFQAVGEGRLELRLTPRGATAAEAEMSGVQLTGRVDAAGRSVDFRLRGQVRAQKPGARMRVLAGRAALRDAAAGDGWHVELATRAGGSFDYELVCEREGVLPVDFAFTAAVEARGEWRALEFTMPAGAVVPLHLEGLDGAVTFKPDSAIVPASTAQGWRGWVPADGTAALAWRRAPPSAAGALAFTSTEQTEVRLGAGLLRQSSQISFRILQGVLSGVRLTIEGPGEIIGVEGANLVGWKVVPAGGGRVLDVRLSRPIEAQGTLVIQSQQELGAWPARGEPIRLTPEAGVRHSGVVRVANSGAVRLEVADATGMMQLAATQFPGAAVEAGARQVFVYRFPSASYGYHVAATQIQPEISVSAIATCELGETNRVIQAALELDVREAPIRDWTLLIPEDYAVVAVSGGEVADHVVASEAADGRRAVRVLFARAVEGRQLLQLRLEKNQPAAAGEWTLPALRFPGAKSVRGHLGAVATPGYRLVPARVDRLVEVPLSFFPRQTAGLQQAWRLRDADWTADLRIEALGQSIQADVFHLYVLKEGVVASSVLLNYFVVGAPATEWRIEVPAGVGNIDVTGQNVRRDWRREGEQLIVALHQPVLGAATLLVTFEQPMSARGGVIAPGQVRPLGVQAERGFLQVVSPLQVKHEIRRAEGGLLKLEPGELPAEFRTFSSAPSLAVYQYTARPFAFELGVEWYTPGETVDQIVDFAQLASQVSRDGQVVTEAKFFVKTRGRKALRLVLPDGVKLWEARVDQEVVSARGDGRQTIVPLPARLNPNDPVTVALRLGQPAAGAGSRLALAAPRVATAPTVISEWRVRGDAGRVLVPEGGNGELLAPALTETGFEWIASRARLGSLVTLALAGLGALLLRTAIRGRLPLGLLALALGAGGALLLTGAALVERRPNATELVFAATVVPVDGNFALALANVPAWRAAVVGWGVGLGAAGLGLLALGVKGSRLGAGRVVAVVAGIVALAAGLLAQRGGAVWFFGALGAGLLLRMLVPGLLLWRRERREAADEPPPAPGAGAAAASSLLVLLGLAGALLGANRLEAAETARADVRPGRAVAPEATRPEQSAPAAAGTLQAVVQRWSIRGERLFAEVDFSLRGGPGDRFVVLRPPAVLTDFQADGLRMTRIERDGALAYAVIPERAGTFSGRLRFELPVADRSQAVALPTGPAALQRVTVELDQDGWEVVSPMSVQTTATPGLPEGRSGATLVLAPHAAPVIRLQPRRRDPATETTQFLVETANVFVPGPGVVSGLARITVRPVQGRVTALELLVPEGLTVGEVARGPVGSWRFDPSSRRLQVAVEPAQTEVFRFEVETQLGAGDLPFPLGLEPLRVRGAAGEVGMLALAFGSEAQPEGVRTRDLAVVNAQDFDGSLLPRTRDGQPLAALHQVWRHGAAGGRVDLKVAAVAPEVRIASRQVLSLDDDRSVMAVDLRVAITRVGLFKLSFPLPAGFELEAASGPALNHWTEAADGAQRIVTLHLNGRTVGEQAFALTLAGPAPGAQEGWAYPRLAVREATRQTGEALVVPGKGLRVRATGRENVTQLDPRTVGGPQPGTLAFRLLQSDWVLRLGIELLDPWVTVQSLQEITLREGQTLTRIALRYRVENAAVKQVRVRLPGLAEAGARTLRATGPAVSDWVKVADQPDTWEIRFQRGIAGETEVQLEFQGPAAGDRGRESVVTPELPGTRQAVQFVALRTGGRIELEAGALPRGWTRVDWSAVPAVLQQRGDRSMPALSFRVAEPEGPLALTVRRHEIAAALKLRVTQGSLVTLFAPAGDSLTAVELKVDVLEKNTLRMRLPAGARLFNTVVNGEGVVVVREGEEWLFHVAPGAAGRRAAVVRFVYSAAGTMGGAVALAGPSLNLPLEDVTWRVVIPPGYDLEGYRGGLRLREERHGAAFGVDQYVSAVSSRRSAEAKEAMSILQQAGSWLQQGEQDKAAEAFSRVSNGAALDPAANEDARVQLRNLKTQQAILGLNTRRQRLYLDNRGDATRNDQLEKAATLNPFMQGKVNFDPQQVDQLLLGNTAEENSALRGIAARIVDQQLTTEAAPGAIEVTLPERGRVVTFARSLQVDGGAPLQLQLDVTRITRSSPTLSVLLLAGLAGIAAIELGRRSAGPG